MFWKTEMSEVIYTLVIRCPFYGFEKEETMPEDACQFFMNTLIVKRLLNLKK